MIEANLENTYQALEEFTRDLTELANKGKLDPEIRRFFANA